VKYKDKETGMLYNVMIYNFRDGTDNAHILLADSASLETSADKQHLLLHLYNGEQFENFNSAALMAENEPYRRETFCIKHFIIEFDSSFNLEDSETFSSSASTKDIVQITADIDSMNQEVDSLCRAYYNDMCRGSLMLPEVNTQVAGIDKKIISRGLKALEGVPFDSIYASLPPNSRDRALRMAIQKVNSQQVDTKFKSEWIDEYDTRIRRHWVQYHQMITLSLACLVFFFIGAPLGAIMRKGGLGLPVVVSVVIFIIYYIINTGGMKLGKQGTIPVWIGMWVSTAVLAPLGVFFTVKSNNDSVVFNMDAYKAFFRKLFGLRLSRHVARKEVIIDDPDYSNMSVLFKNLSERAKKYLASNDLIRFPNYINIFFKIEQDWEINSIADNMEKGIERLSNSKDREIIRLLNYFPFLDPYAHTAPFKNKKLNIAAGVFFPVGIVLIFRIARFRLRLRKDLKNIVKTSKSVYRRCDELETR
jgi:lipopolysaccharide export system permease protein